MKTPRQIKGFTLIELMIVVAIIGILAAVAIPSYQDYTARAQVSEAVGITSSYKTVMSEYVGTNGNWPTHLTVVGSIVTGKYVASVTMTGGGGTGALVIQAKMSANVNKSIQNKIFSIATTNGNIWDCGEIGGAAAATDLDTKYLPTACRL